MSNITYMAWVSNKEWRKYGRNSHFICSTECSARNKADFLETLRLNGYKVHECLRADIYNYCLDNTDCTNYEKKIANMAVKMFGEINDETFDKAWEELKKIEDEKYKNLLLEEAEAKDRYNTLIAEINEGLKKYSQVI